MPAVALTLDGDTFLRVDLLYLTLTIIALSGVRTYGDWYHFLHPIKNEYSGDAVPNNSRDPHCGVQRLHSR